MTTFYKEILPEVLILILNYNQKNDTLACIESLGKLSYSNFRVLLIDNNSQDASAEAVLQKFPKVTVIKSKINLGCAGGRNVGIEYFLKQTKADYLFFLDNDTVVDRGLLNELVHKGESDSDIGVVSLKAYYFNQPNKFWFVGGAKINWREGNFYNSGQGEVDRGQFDQDKEIDSVPGGFTFIKRRVLEIVGKIDERYFIYYEDSDWCVRVKRAGYKIAFAPNAKLWHKASSSLGMESPSFYYYRARNRLFFMLKNAPKFYLPIFFIYFFYDFSYRTLLTLYLSKKNQEFKTALAGVKDFLKGINGERVFS